MSDISCEALFNMKQPQLLRKLEPPATGSDIRMPRTHELHLFQDGMPSNLQNNLEEEKESVQCIHCKKRSTSDDLKVQHINISTNYLCYTCSIDLLADETVKTVLKKFCFRSIDSQSQKNSGKMEILTSLEIDDTKLLNLLNDNERAKEDIEGNKKIADESELIVSKPSEENNMVEDFVICSICAEVSDDNDLGWEDKITENLSEKKSNQILFNTQLSKTSDSCDSPTSPASAKCSSVRINVGVKICQYYTDEKRIGGGRFGKVSKMTKKETNEIVAVKTIVYRNPETRKNIQNEIQILDALRGNDNILQLIEVIDNNLTNPKTVHLITEYLGGGELYEQIAKDELLTEVQVIDIMCQLLNGVRFIHKNGIIHRDLKPENIVYTSKDSGHLKIIDFGFATKFNNKNPPKTMVGTTVFVAPEVLRYEPQSYLTDMWSVGVIAFNLLAGITPFEIPLTGDLRRQLTDTEIIENIERCQYDFNDDGFIGVSEEAKDFISNLLIRDPKKRLTADQSLQHIWLTSCYQNKFRCYTRSISLQRMKNYVAIQKWQKISLAIQSINQFKNAIISSSKPNI